MFFLKFPINNKDGIKYGSGYIKTITDIKTLE